MPPNFMVVLDRSCSMDDALAGTTTTKWQAAVAALDHAMTAHATDVRWGLTLFPDTTGWRCTQDAIPIPIADDNAGPITTLLTNALDRADDPRHGGRPSQPRDGAARTLGIDATERVGEAVEVGLAPLLAVADHVDAGPLHVGHGQAHGVVLGLVQPGRWYPPHLRQPYAGDDVPLEALAVHQPGGLRIAADDGRPDRLVRHEPIQSRRLATPGEAG